MLGLPLVFDQPRNAIRMVRKGYAEVIEWDDLTTDLLVTTINKMLEDPRYSYMFYHI